MPKGVGSNSCGRHCSLGVVVFKYNIRSSSNTMQRECRTSFKLHYIFYRTLICIASLVSVPHHCYHSSVSRFHRTYNFTPPSARVYGLSTSHHTTPGGYHDNCRYIDIVNFLQPTPTPTPCLCYKSWNNTWAPSTRSHRLSYTTYSLKHLHSQSSRN